MTSVQEPNAFNDTFLGGEILSILEAEGAEETPLLLSKLGLRLSSKLQKPLREILGLRRLRDVVASTLGSSIAFEGSASSLAVALSRNVPQGPRSVRYDKAFWAAFSKPIAAEEQRFLKVTRPFDFSRVPEGDGYLEVPRHLIPDPDLPKSEREIAVLSSIAKWCSENGLRTGDFILAAAAVPKNVQVRSEHVGNLSALVALIEAIPPEERFGFSLPMDLIYRLITK